MKSRLHAYIGTFRQLEILLSVYKHRSVSLAAEALHLTQPTISMQLKKLADAIGEPLYNQINRQLIFTDAGKAVAECAQEVLESIGRLDMLLADLRGLKAGSLNIAVVTTSKYFIPHLLGPFCKYYPDVDVSFKVGNREQIIARLKEGQDDFYVFSHPPEDESIELFEFLPNPLVAICQNDHPLLKNKSVSLKEFAKEDFLMREIGSGTRYAIDEYFKKNNISLNVKMTIESNEAIKHSVINGLGVSILSSHTLAFEEHQGIMQLPIKDFPIQTNWYFVWLKKKRLSLIANTFLNYVQTEGKEIVIKTLNNYKNEK